MGAGYKKQWPNLEKKSRRTDYFLYKKKEKKKITILHAYCVQNFGTHIPYTLKIMLSKHREYHHILDAYAGYKKQRPNLEKKSRRTDYFLYKKKLQYFMPIVFRISVHIFHIHSKLCFQSTGNIIIYYLRMLVIRNKGQIWKKKS